MIGLRDGASESSGPCSRTEDVVEKRWHGRGRSDLRRLTAVVGARAGPEKMGLSERSHIRLRQRRAHSAKDGGG